MKFLILLIFLSFSSFSYAESHPLEGLWAGDIDLSIDLYDCQGPRLYTEVTIEDDLLLFDGYVNCTNSPSFTVNMRYKVQNGNILLKGKKIGEVTEDSFWHKSHAYYDEFLESEGTASGNQLNFYYKKTIVDYRVINIKGMLKKVSRLSPPPRFPY